MSYVSSYHHCVFSTKERRPLISPALWQRLWPFLGGIARQNKMKAIEIGGVEDHVHILLSLPPTASIAKSLQLIKGCSSKWVYDLWKISRPFGTRGLHHPSPPLKRRAILTLSLRDTGPERLLRFSYVVVVRL